MVDLVQRMALPMKHVLMVGIDPKVRLHVLGGIGFVTP